MSSDDNINVLDSNLLPFWKIHNANNRFGLFMQDKAVVRNSKKSLNRLKMSQIEVINWRAFSADLNPIENMWTILENHLNCMMKSVKHYWNGNSERQQNGVKL